MPYEYKEDPPKKKVAQRDEDGKVVIAPNNFVTTRLKVGRVGKGTTFGGKIPYVEDDNEGRRKKETRTEMELHNTKLPEDGKAFSQVGGALRWGTFNKPKDIYGGPSLAATRDNLKFRSQKVLPDIHEGAMFKPAGPGKKNKTIGKFPSFMKNPPNEVKRVKKEEGGDDIPPFKMTTKVFSRPTPSVVTNFRNIRSAFPGSFRR